MVYHVPPPQSLNSLSFRYVASDVVGKALAVAVLSESASEDTVAAAADAVAKALVLAVSRQGTPTNGSPKGSSKPPSRLGTPQRSIPVSKRPSADIPLPPGGMGAKPPSRQGTPSVPSRLGSPGMGGGFAPLGPLGGDGGSLSAADRAALMTPPGSRPGTAGREEIEGGIEEMRRQMSQSRKQVEDAAAELRKSFSRPGSASVLLPAPPVDAQSQAIAAALEAQMQNLQEAERLMLTSLMASPAALHSPSVLDAGSPSSGVAEVWNEEVWRKPIHSCLTVNV